MKKPLTAEQKQATAERRDRFKALVKKVAAMTPDERKALVATTPGIMTVERHTLSPVNSILIMMQNPEATIVGGFNQWIKNGRTVRKGEHGFSIWIPLNKAAGPAGAGTNEQPDELHFGSGTVFDITQTKDLAEATA